MARKCEGNVKFRGSSDAIIRLVEECFVDEIGRPVWRYVDSDDTVRGYIYFARNENVGEYKIKYEQPIIVDPRYDAFIRRMSRESSTAEFMIHVTQNYNLAREAYRVLSKRYNARIKAVGYERSMRFKQSVEFFNGLVLNMATTNYPEYFWDAEEPYYGG